MGCSTHRGQQGAAAEVLQLQHTPAETRLQLHGGQCASNAAPDTPHRRNVTTSSITAHCARRNPAELSVQQLQHWNESAAPHLALPMLMLLSLRRWD